MRLLNTYSRKGKEGHADHAEGGCQQASVPSLGNLISITNSGKSDLVKRDSDVSTSLSTCSLNCLTVGDGLLKESYQSPPQSISIGLKLIIQLLFHRVDQE